MLDYYTKPSEKKESSPDKLTSNPIKVIKRADIIVGKWLSVGLDSTINSEIEKNKEEKDRPKITTKKKSKNN